jgi:hypothetical protein
VVDLENLWPDSFQAHCPAYFEFITASISGTSQRESSLLGAARQGKPPGRPAAPELIDVFQCN